MYMVVVAHPVLGSGDDESEISVSQLQIMGTVWQLLPEELLHRILLFLPTRSICRLRLVCKQWRALLSSGWFFQSKDVVAPSEPLICSLDDARMVAEPPEHCLPLKPYRWDLSSMITKEVLDSLPEGHDPWLETIIQSGDGLVCFIRRRKDGDNLIVVNPATRTFRVLPEVPGVLFSCTSAWGTVTMDEPFGTEFTISLHWSVSITGADVLGVYTSRNNTWTMYWDSAGKAVVCSRFYFDLKLVEGAEARRPKLGQCSGKCVVYSFAAPSRRLVLVGEAPIPGLHLLHLEDCYGEGWRLLVHGGKVYLLALILRRSVDSVLVRGVGIWKLDAKCWRFDQVAMTPIELIEELHSLREGEGRNSFSLVGVSSVGDFICLVLSAAGNDDDLEHTVAFNFRNRSWRVLYSLLYTETSDRSVSLEDDESDDDIPDWRQRPLLMVPNFHLYL